MSKFYFIPEDWVLSAKLRTWTREKGLSDATIENEIESFMDHQYKRAMSRPDACWRNWIRNGIKWGSIETVSCNQYRTVVELTDEQRSADILKFERDVKRYRK